MDLTPGHDRDLELVTRIDAVASILGVLCAVTGLGFAAVTRIRDGTWTACAVHDDAGYDIRAGTRFEASATICGEVVRLGEPIALDRISEDPVGAGFSNPRVVGYETYVAVPIVLASGERFGALCAWDRQAAHVDNARTRLLFEHFAGQIASEIDARRSADTVLRELFDERADSASRERFLAVLGHDLRNPLSSISGCAQVLKLKNDDPQLVAKMADRVVANVQRMAGMIADLMDLARGRQGGGIELDRHDIEALGPALESVVDELRIAYPDRQLVSRIRIEGAVPGDKGRLQQLVSNLVGNAITHGAADTPVLITAETQNHRLTIEVHNEGAPIPDETMPGLFDPYTRQAGPKGKPREGLGLGLYICEQIVAAHGGKFEVSSTMEGGTTFRATIPIQPRQARAGASA